MIAKSAFGEHLTRCAGPLAEKLAAGFRADAFHYLLFLRLVPVFPFFLVNLVPAHRRRAAVDLRRRHRHRDHPGDFAFAFLGAGLDSVIRAQGAVYNACLASGRTDCRLDFDFKAAVTPELLGALAALGVLALIPVVGEADPRAARRPVRPGRARGDRRGEGMAELITPDICVIGAGSGGLSVAAAAAAFGVPVVLIEKGRMGGECLNSGCVPSKALIAAARRAHGVTGLDAFGITASAPQIDFARVHDARASA